MDHEPPADGRQYAGTKDLVLRLLGPLALAWAVMLLMLAFASLFGLPIGLGVVPMGEDKVWTELLRQNTSLELHRQWWKLSSRNPLASWWYAGFSHFVLKVPESIYLVRKVVDLLLASAVTLLVDQLGRGRTRWLALAVGLLVLLWNFSSYLEQILLTMLIAFGMSILSVWAYCRYLDSGRALGDALAASLVLFFAALATYSIQCGVPLAIFLLGTVRGVPRGTRFAPRVARGLRDAAPFVALFVLFMMIWVSASGPTSSYFKLDLRLIATHLPQSLAGFLWHFDTTALLGSIRERWASATIVLVWVGASALAFLFIAKDTHRETPADQQKFRVAVLAMGLATMIFVALVLPTLAIEMTSVTWPPGSRSRMVQQVFQPVAYVSLCVSIGYLAKQAVSWSGRRVTSLLVAGLIGFAAVIAAEYNRQLVEQTTLERNLEAGLKSVIPGISRATHFVVRMDGVSWYGGQSPGMTNLFVQSIYGTPLATLDAIYPWRGTSTSQVDFGEHASGVFSPAVGRRVPYQDVVVMRFDGVSAAVIERIDEAAFRGYDARISSPVPGGPLPAAQGGRQSATCPSVLDFTSTPRGSGWSVAEVSASGDPFVWMAASSATVELETSCPGPLELQFRTLLAMAPDILESLKVEVNGIAIPVAVRHEPDSSRFHGVVPSEVRDGRVIIRFTVNRTIVPDGGARTLAVPFNRLTLSEAVR